MRCLIVSHTHWDREWYKSFQSFRARLVDTIDRILELVEVDPGYSFQLDGQSIVVEDYLAIRPQRRDALEAAIRAGRIAIGPWYVQPDSLIPTGETHVRNLLEGRRVAEQYGACSKIAYTPDSFGHPAQFPQLFEGFGLGPFIYWRGNDDEIARLPSEYRWRAPNGSTLLACHLARGYFPAWGLSDDLEATSARLERLARELEAASGGETVLLMNGFDHMLPDDNTRAAAEALAKRTGWTVERGLLDDYVAALPAEVADAPVFEGELVGGRVANLLPGVWSTHMELKLANRRCEHALQRELEPFAVFGLALAELDERPSLREAWRALLPNQAHDSICGCSQDRVHTQMTSRLEEVEELAGETTTRLLERLSGLGVDRQLRPGADGELAIAVWNPSPYARTDRVRLPLSGFPAYTKHGVQPLLQANADIAGITVNGHPARVTAYAGTVRPRLSPEQPVHDVEFVAEDVPAFGWRRFTLAASETASDVIDDGREIRVDGLSVRVDEVGCFDVELGERRFVGLCALEDQGDRGDTYDFDPVGEPEVRIRSIEVSRRIHASGMQSLSVLRVLDVPGALGAERDARTEERVALPVRITAELAPGVPRIDLRVEIDNTARDHRLRVLFPVGAKTDRFDAATTFGCASRAAGARQRPDWIHPAPATVAQQGWVHAGELTVAAPGLLEAEVSTRGVIALTLVRSVGWLSRPDLTTRPGPAGPSLSTPGAQCLGPLEARLSLHTGSSHRALEAAEQCLLAVPAGPAPALPCDEALLSIDAEDVSLSALKPADDGRGAILRLLNHADSARHVEITLAPRLAARIASVSSARLDEQPDPSPVEYSGRCVRVDVPGYGLRSLRLELGDAARGGET